MNSCETSPAYLGGEGVKDVTWLPLAPSLPCSWKSSGSGHSLYIYIYKCTYESFELIILLKIIIFYFTPSNPHNSIV